MADSGPRGPFLIGFGKLLEAWPYIGFEEEKNNFQIKKKLKQRVPLRGLNMHKMYIMIISTLIMIGFNMLYNTLVWFSNIHLFPH